MTLALWALPARAGDLDPRGRIHVPIGVANTNDRLKTFVEPEGCFSPGVGSYGVYFWASDPATGKLVAPTQTGVKVEHGLPPGGALIPWSKWAAGTVQIKTEVCHTLQASEKGEVHVVAARAHLTNPTDAEIRLTFFAVVRPMGPAGFPIRKMANSPDALHVDAHPALLAATPPTASTVAATDDPAALTAAEADTSTRTVDSPAGDASGALRYVLTLKPNQTTTLGFLCPVLPGRRVLPHQWDGKSTWAQFDLAPYNSPDSADPQPSPGTEYYKSLKIDDLFAQAAEYYKDLTGRATLTLPDPRWADALNAITAHAALAMNDDAPDVTAVNYNVFNRDGVYVTNILHKAGRPDLAARCIDYFLKHPFNGRVEPEADNPGQILWVIGEHWRFTRDDAWLERVYPSVKKLADMVRYYRTTPEPHYVWDTSLDFGDALPKDQRKRLKPGACDGHHPEYTEAWDVAGLRAAAECARALKNDADAATFTTLAADLFKKYDATYGNHLAKEYGSYSVLWPCRLYPIASSASAPSPGTPGEGRGEGLLDLTKAVTQFKSIGVQKSTSWRYFPLAKSHQGLLAGNRDAGHKTINTHLDHEQMSPPFIRDPQGSAPSPTPTQGFFAFDEGGKSGAGGWKSPDGKPLLRTTWNGDVAMPHGWANAELHLLIRDSLVHEDGDKLILLAGIPPEWFRKEFTIENLPTHFGPLTLAYKPDDAGAGGKLLLSGAEPPAGYVVRTPAKDVAVAPMQPEVQLP
jgi:hypothetical protein